MKKKKIKKVIKKKSAKKSVKKSAAKKKITKPKPIGAVTHYFGKIKVAIIKFKQPIRLGQEVCFTGHTTDFCQAIASMQFDHEPVMIAKKGKQVGIKVSKKVREGDAIFLK